MDLIMRETFVDATLVSASEQPGNRKRCRMNC